MIRLFFGILTLALVSNTVEARTRHNSERPIIASVPCDFYINPACLGQGTFTLSRKQPRKLREARSEPRRAKRHPVRIARPATIPGGLVTILTAAGNVTINSGIAERMKGFIADVVERGFTGRVHCFAGYGHVHRSTHHSGGGCDFAQTGWNRTHKVMYRVADLVSKWGLRDGCTFKRRKDCGHIDGGNSYNAPPTNRRYASRHHRRHYASR